MSGETNLARLSREMQPELQEGEYVFCLFDAVDAALAHAPVGLFVESEGVTGILGQSAADQANLPYSTVCKWITLEIHSSLEAVGLTAAVSRALTEEGISCNVVAAYYHDHPFVPTRDAERALQVLLQLSEVGDDGQTNT